MNLKEITIDGKVYDLVPREETTPKPKKTGYERADPDVVYFTDDAFPKKPSEYAERSNDYDDTAFENANYYTDKKLAEDNIRADRLLRRLRRFSAVNRKNKIDWENSNQAKFIIFFDYDDEELPVTKKYFIRHFGEIYFDTEELAEKAIEEFKDDLMWYFTEYKDIAEESAEDDD